MRSFIRGRPVLSFFVLAWLFSWVFMIPLALARHGVIASLPGWLHYLSAYGPLLAALLIAGLTEGAAGLRTWWARLTRWRCGFLPWLLAVSPLLLYVVAAVIQRLAQGAWPDVGLLGRVNFLPYMGLWSLPLWLANSGLGEETGWRGYALPALQRRFSPRRSSVIVAAGWMVWHVPAFFYLPSYDHFSVGMAFGFFLGLLSGAFLLTWLANSTGGSVLLPVIWHGLFNYTTAPPSSGGLIAPVISTAVMVLGVLALWRLKRGPRAPG
jgi:uncharacterized protein